MSQGSGGSAPAHERGHTCRSGLCQDIGDRRGSRGAPAPSEPEPTLADHPTRGPRCGRCRLTASLLSRDIKSGEPETTPFKPAAGIPACDRLSGSRLNNVHLPGNGKLATNLPIRPPAPATPIRTRDTADPGEVGAPAGGRQTSSGLSRHRHVAGLKHGRERCLTADWVTPRISARGPDPNWLH